MYDSREDTYAHIDRVGDLLRKVIRDFQLRAARHDASKLYPPEKEAFDEVTPKLKELTYGSDEYRAYLTLLKPALDHHYAHNSHHPEHYVDGILGMNLGDIYEMVMDWKAASERHADGNIWKSIEINIERFKIEPQLASIIRNTAKAMGW